MSNRSEIRCIQRFVITVVATFDLHMAYLCVACIYCLQREIIVQ